jgi:hypothetical protein
VTAVSETFASGPDIPRVSRNARSFLIRGGSTSSSLRLHTAIMQPLPTSGLIRTVATVASINRFTPATARYGWRISISIIDMQPLMR